MYRNVSYKIDADWNGHVWFAGWDAEGNRVEKWINHSSHLYYEDPHGEYVSMFDTKLARKQFKSVADRKRWITSNPNLRTFESLPPTREFLFDLFAGTQEEEDFQKHPLRIAYLDLEVASMEDREEAMPKLAKCPINVLTIFDSLTETYNCFYSLEHAGSSPKPFVPPSMDNVSYHPCKNEQALLICLLSWWESHYPDVLTGWNIDGYDIPYLVARIEKVLGEEQVVRLSPIKEVKKHQTNTKGRWNNTFRFGGISVLDYFPLYAEKFATGSKQSYKLDAICQDELGDQKVSSPYESFMEFWQSDFSLYIEYNIHDVRLLVKLEAKLKLIELTRKICNLGLCEYENIFKSFPYIYGAITLECAKHGKKILSDNRKEPPAMGIEGAYVFPSQVGVYRGGVCSFDFNSLYPNIMVLLNISPETKIGKIVQASSEEHVTIKTETGNKAVSKQKFKDMLSNGQCTISGNNVLYVNPELKPGIMPSFIKRLYNERVKYRKMASAGKASLRKMKEEGKKISPEKLKEIEDKIIKYDTTQQSYKIFLNSLYGVLSNKYFPLADRDSAEAVTLTGQDIIKHMSKLIDEYFQNTYGVDTQTNTVTIFGDTDSLYLNVAEMVKNTLGYIPKEWNPDEIIKVCEKLDIFTDRLNEECFKYTQKRFNSPLKRIEFKRESFCSGAVTTTKKRYMLHIRNEGGDEVISKFKYTGLDIKKNELPLDIKKRLQYVVEHALTDHWTATDFRQWCEETWEQFQKLPYDSLALIQNYSSKKDSPGFLQVEKGSGSHARAAIYYNQIVDKLKLNKKCEKISVGDRIRYIYCSTSNEFGVDVIGWKGDCPKEWMTRFKPDYKKMFQRCVLGPLEAFIEIYRWNNFDPNVQFEASINDL
ncbi:MAG TPA: DNA polymerase domain-containing protein [Saccharofermentans sp.]|nr:DNA polymerase domain-containing protein [Saccharofermentans sp.]